MTQLIDPPPRRSPVLRSTVRAIVDWAAVAGVALFYAGLCGAVVVPVLVLFVEFVSGSPQVLVDLGASMLDSSSAAGDAVTVPEAIGTVWLFVAAGVVGLLTFALARSGAVLAGAVARPKVRVTWPLAAAIAGGCLAIWWLRPALHPLAMLFYEYPLVTWIPALIAALVAFVSGRLRRLRRHAVALGVCVAVASWVLFMCALPSWQGHALYEASDYRLGALLPTTTQPRLLPKAAARSFAGADGLRHAHLVVDPATGGLVWSAEEKPGLVPRGASHAIALQPVERVDGTLERQDVGFDPAVSRTGPGSLPWRAFDRHYFTRVQDPVIVPLGGGRAVAVAPYIGYRGFPVRHPYWAGVYVYHQDGSLEDLTPQEALARPELARSGRLFPEKLARDTAEAYGYRTGAEAALLDRPRTEIDDPAGNPQPYLTHLGDGRVAWVTTAHPTHDDDSVSALFLTDAATGATSVWRPGPGARPLSNDGAAALADGLPLHWTACCDDGDKYDIRRVTEPRPVFAHGHFYYLVSIVPVNGFHTKLPVDRTVLVDAEARRVVRVYDHADSEADDALRVFFHAIDGQSAGAH